MTRRSHVAPAHEYAQGAQERRGGLYALPQAGGSKSRPYTGVFTVKSQNDMSVHGSRPHTNGKSDTYAGLDTFALMSSTASQKFCF